MKKKNERETRRRQLIRCRHHTRARVCVCVRVNCYCFCFRHWKDGMCVCVRNCATYLSFHLTCVCLYGHLVGTGLCSNMKKNREKDSLLTYRISLQVNYCWCLIVVSYIKGRYICKQDDLSLMASVFSLFLFFSSFVCYLIGTDDERLSSLSLFHSVCLYHHQRDISCSIEDQFPSLVFIPSGVAGLLLFVYTRIIVQALICKLPMAYCTCNSFSTRNE